jgi:hypothetical protein
MRLKTTAVSLTAGLALAITPAFALAAKPATHSTTAPGQLCKTMSHKKTNHGKGKSPFAACVIGVNRARAELAKNPATTTSPSQLCKDLSHKKAATDKKTPYSACVSGAAKAQHTA